MCDPERLEKLLDADSGFLLVGTDAPAREAGRLGCPSGRGIGRGHGERATGAKKRRRKPLVSQHC